MNELWSRKMGQETRKTAAGKEKTAGSACLSYENERKSFNLTDLVTDHTIDVNNETSSTLSRSSMLSVEEILASSFAPQTRNLRSSLRNSGARSNPFEVTGGSVGSQSTLNPALLGEAFESIRANFVPGELMESKLLKDENSWAQDYCAMPTIMSSTRVKPGEATAGCSSFFDQSVIKSPQNTSEVSIGSYFKVRSENVGRIIKGETPYKSHTLFPLIDESTEGNTFTVQTATMKEELQSPAQLQKSSNAAELMSISDIDRALSDANMQLDESGSHLVDQIMRKAKKRLPAASRCSSNSHSLQTRAATKSHSQTRVSNSNDESGTRSAYFDDVKAMAEYLSENKENIFAPVLVGGKKCKESLSGPHLLDNVKQRPISSNRTPLANIETCFTPTASMSSTAGGNMQIADTQQKKKHSTALTSKETQTPIKVQKRTTRLSESTGKAFPIKVTTLELSWPSTKLRSTKPKTMQIKNITHAVLAVRLAIQGAGFQIANSPAKILTLQAQECHAITIAFCPTIAGAAHGKLSLSLPHAGKKGHPSLLDIPLYGYGGHASIVIQGILKSPVGNPFLTMGEFSELSEPLRRKLTICNKGPLMGFVVININAVGLNIANCSAAFQVIPEKLLIPAGKTATVNVIFQPERATIRGLAQLKANVINLASMRIVYGDEANRQRIRALVQRMSSAEYAKLNSKALQSLVVKFPGEVEHQIKFAEKPNYVNELLCNLHQYELALTLNRDQLNDSADGDDLALADANETLLFRTVCEQPADVSMAAP